MDDTEIRLRCVALCAGDVYHAQRVYDFVVGRAAEAPKSQSDMDHAYEEAGPEQSTEEFLADLKSGDEAE